MVYDLINMEYKGKDVIDMGKIQKKIKKGLKVSANTILIAGVMIAFYKLPSIIAEKISYRQLKNKDIKQDLEEEE